MTSAPEAYSQGTLARDVLRVSGSDVLPFLHGLLTTRTEDLKPGEMRHGALLTPQGKILDTMFLSCIGENDLLIDVDAGRAAPLLKRLSLYKLRAAVELEAVTDTMSVHVSPAPVEEASLSVVDPRLGALGYRSLVAKAAGAAAVDEAYCALEISLGVPAYGVAYTEGDAFPLGVNLDRLGGIDHQKGCFVGQEVASRMFRKGDIRKRTWQLSGTGLSACQELYLDGKSVAMVSAVAGDRALGLMRLDRLPESASGVEISTEAGGIIKATQPEYLA